MLKAPQVLLVPEYNERGIYIVNTQHLNNNKVNYPYKETTIIMNLSNNNNIYVNTYKQLNISESFYCILKCYFVATIYIFSISKPCDSSRRNFQFFNVSEL